MLQANQFDPSMMIATSRPPLVDFTDEALKQVADRLEKNKSKGIHFGLTGGGCAGFSYVFNYADGPAQESDIEIDFGKFKVWMDVMSEMYLAGTLISWKVEGLNEGFEFVNPQEQSACGCGVSVSFQEYIMAKTFRTITIRRTKKCSSQGQGGRGRSVKISMSTMNKNKKRSHKKYRGQGR